MTLNLSNVKLNYTAPIKYGLTIDIMFDCTPTTIDYGFNIDFWNGSNWIPLTAVWQNLTAPIYFSADVNHDSPVVLYSKSGGWHYKYTTTIDKTKLQLPDGNVSGLKFRVQVSEIESYENGPFIETSPFDIKAVNDAPTLPVISLESDYYSYVKLTWPKSTDKDGDQIFYDVEMQDVSSGGAYTVISTIDNNTVVGDIVNFQYDFPVKKTTVLGFRVKARDNTGQSSEYTPSKTAQYFAFSPVSNVKCEGDFRLGGKIKISWDPSVNSGANPIQYKIELNGTIATVPEGTTSYEYVIPNTLSYLIDKPISAIVKVSDTITMMGRPVVNSSIVYIRSNTAPNKSGSILYDTGISIGLDKVTALWEVVTDGSDTVTYDVDLYDNGSWVNIATGLTANSHDCQLPDKDLVKAKLRVRSFDGILYSDYIEGPVFTNFKATHHAATKEHLLSALSSAKAFIVSSIQTIKIATVSLLTNDAGYKTVAESDAIINPVLDDAKAYVNQSIAGLTQFVIIKVDTLPTVDIKEKTLYLVPSSDAKDDNILDEYLYLDSKWEYMGTKKLDLSGYDNKTIIDTKISVLQNINTGANQTEIDEINSSIWN